MNKVSTKVEMRFVVSEAEWLPHDVRLRLARHEKGRVNSKGELVVTAQEFRYIGLFARPSRTHKFVGSQELNSNDLTRVFTHASKLALVWEEETTGFGYMPNSPFFACVCGVFIIAVSSRGSKCVLGQVRGPPFAVFEHAILRLSRTAYK